MPVGSAWRHPGDGTEALPRACRGSAGGADAGHVPRACQPALARYSSVPPRIIAAMLK